MDEELRRKIDDLISEFEYEHHLYPTYENQVAYNQGAVEVIEIIAKTAPERLGCFLNGMRAAIVFMKEKLAKEAENV